MTKLKMIAMITEVLKLKENDTVEIQQSWNEYNDTYKIIYEDSEWFLVDDDDNTWDEATCDLLDLQINLIKEILEETIISFKIKND